MAANPSLGDPAAPESVLRLLPEGWSANGGSLLDLDREAERAPSPPLAPPDASCELIWAQSAFTRFADDWAEWLLEVHRLLREEGLLVVTLAGRRAYEELTGATWDEDRIGMTALFGIDGERPAVFHSEWWLREHWGRAFEPLTVDRDPEATRIALRRRSGSLTPEDLRRPGPDARRELAAALENVALLRRQLLRLAERHRYELANQREDLERELMRHAFAAADLEWARGGPGSPGALVAAEYEATTSWRVTRPLRAIGGLLRRVR